MGQKENLTQVSVQGLATNPNANALPAGSCSEANNVTIRRPGMLAPMMQDRNVATVPDDFVTVRTLYDDQAQQLVVVAVDTPGSPSETSVGALYPYTPGSPTFTPGTAVTELPDFYNGDTRDIGFMPGMTQTAFSHFRQLVTEKWGIIVNRERFAGLTNPTGAITAALTTPGFLEADNACSYRAILTLEHTASNQNYVVVGPPSSIGSIFNDSGVSRDVRVSFYIPQDEPTIHYGLMTGYKLYLNIYRSSQNAVTTVDDLPFDFRRVAKILIDDTTDTVIHFDDYVTEDARNGGEDLYSNPSQEGEDQASYAPPCSRDVCVFKDTAFYANRSAFPTLKLTVPGAFGVLLTDQERTFGIGDRDVFTGTSVIGSPVITFGSASDVLGISPGQVLATSSGGFPAGAYVVSVLGLTVTMSGNATIHVVGTMTGTFRDQITVVQHLSTGGTSTITGNVVIFDLDVVNQAVRGFRLLHPAVDYRRNVPSIELTAINVYPALDRCTSFDVYVTNGQNYSPAYTGNYLTLTNPLTSLIDQRPNLVFCAKTGEPEAVPPLNQFQIGAGTVYKMWANQSAIFFFCSDGLWKITGDEVSNFQVSQVDPTVYLVHPDCVTSLNNQIYSWITDGISLVTEDGANTISTDAIGPEIRSVASQLQGVSFWGPSMSADNYFNEVWVNARTFYNAELPPTNGWIQTFLYNDDTKNFSTQDHHYLCVTYLPVAARMSFVSVHNDVLVQVHSDYDIEEFGVVARSCEVWFNPLQTADKGNLKQWMDLYFFVVGYVAGDSNLLKALFDSRGTETDSTLDTVNVRDMAVIRRDLHYWCPRRAALGDQLQIGFRSLTAGDVDDDTSFYFEFQGFKLRYRVASDTLKR